MHPAHASLLCCVHPNCPPPAAANRHRPCAVAAAATAGSKEVQLRLLSRGEETVLGDAASDSEVFLTTDLETRCVGGAVMCVGVVQGGGGGRGGTCGVVPGALLEYEWGWRR